MQETNKNQFSDALLKSGASFGASKTKRHPSMKSFIQSTKKGFDIINIEKTSEQLKSAYEFMSSLGAQRKIVLIVGAKPEAKKITQEKAESLGMPYVSGRYIGGTITNFSNIKDRIAKLESMKKDKANDNLSGYTKKEQLIMGEKLAKLEQKFGGVADLKKVPDAVLIIDTKREKNAYKEAMALDIPVIGILNTDCDIASATYPITVNDSSTSSLEYVLGVLVDGYQNGKSIKTA